MIIQKVVGLYLSRRLLISKFKNLIFSGTFGMMDEQYIDFKVILLDSEIHYNKILTYKIKPYVQKFCL